MSAGKKHPLCIPVGKIRPLKISGKNTRPSNLIDNLTSMLATLLSLLNYFNPITIKQLLKKATIGGGGVCFYLTSH